MAGAQHHSEGAGRWFAFTTRRPVGVLMVFLAAMVFGTFSMRLLPIDLMPNISYPRLTVRTEYPGAAPAEVENDVSRPLEEILGVVTGLSRVESASRAGYSDVVLEFTWGTDMDEANQDVLEKLDAIGPALPEEAKAPLILRYDPSLDPVLTLSVSGQGAAYEGVEGLKKLRRISDRDVRRALEPLEGVAAVKVKGGLEEEIQVSVDEVQLRRTNIAIGTVISRLAAENINLAGGTMRDGRTRYLVRTVNEFRDLDDIRNTVLVSREGRDIRLRDIASVTHGYKDREVITRVDGAESVQVEVFKEADANIVEMAAGVRERVGGTLAPKLQETFGAQVRVVSDRSSFIAASVAEVRNTAVIGGLLAVVVLFLFLRDVRTTLVVAVAIPISVLMTFAPLNLAGVSLNIMSLGGLALGIGMLVDNSIVVLESIHRCRQEGDGLIAATIRGTGEVGAAVFASTMTSIAVFFPMVFVEGVAGQMFGDLGLTVVCSLLASLAVALFFIPMLASRDVSVGASDDQGVLRALLAMWGSMRAWSLLRASMRGAGRRWILAPYWLLRWLGHTVAEVLGRLVMTVMLVLAALGAGLVALFGRLFAWVTRPLLWLFHWVLGGAERAYPAVIRTSLRHRWAVWLAAVGSMGYVAVTVPKLDTELIPELHQGEFSVEMTWPVGTPIERTLEQTVPLEEEIAARVPKLFSLTTTVGSERDADDAGERGEHTVRMQVTLSEPLAGAQAGARGEVEASLNESSAAEASKPGTPAAAAGPGPDGLPSDGGEPLSMGISRLRDPVSAEAAAFAVVREAVDSIPDLAVTLARPVLFSFKTPVEVEVRGHDLEALGESTRRVREALSRIDGLRDVRASIRPGAPEIHIDYDRDALARYNLDIRQVAELVRDKVQGNEATRYTERDRKIPVRVRLHGIREAGVEELRALVVNPGAARPLPLTAVARVEQGRGPNEIRRVDQQRVGVVTANLDGVGLGVATKAIRGVVEGVTLPEGVEVHVAGQRREYERSAQSLTLVLLLSVFLVYVIMAAQFESLLFPFIILLTIPLAFVGVVVALELTGTAISVVVFLGAIMLAGIVVNNAIVLVDYVHQLRERGMGTEEALEVAGRVRLRPILMTTLTTVLGLLPMALGMGDGAEIRAPMALTVIAGLTCSTVLTLIVIPTLYATAARWTRGRNRSEAAERLAADLDAVTDDQLVPEIEVPDGE